jgi:hypothetical protein
MSAAYLLKRLEDIAIVSTAMLAAAHEDDWAEVAWLKGRAEIAINEVRMLSETVELSAEERRVKLVLMQRILAIDGQIQELSQPWLKRLGRWLSTGGTVTSQFEGVQR